MSYESIDALQKALASDVFHYTRDPKKAAGRALGTLVEIINFYLLKAWGYETSTAIERRIPEYANQKLTHNVEFTLHPNKKITSLVMNRDELPFTARKIAKKITEDNDVDVSKIKSHQLLSSEKVLRNSCTIQEDVDHFKVAYLEQRDKNSWHVNVFQLSTHPYAMFECKRVGVEEGTKKGPQTIEKAKQGAYVARTVSSLQKIRMSDGRLYGFLNGENDTQLIKPYKDLLKSMIDSDNAELLKHFVLTVGVVSNHGNWFTSDDHNKELAVLSQSYDWLLFLTDRGLAKFVNELLLSKGSRHSPVRNAFTRSYTGEKKKNIFTKVNISLEADKAIQSYFSRNIADIENWFNVISPKASNLEDLKNDLHNLSIKNWGGLQT